MDSSVHKATGFTSTSVHKATGFTSTKAKQFSSKIQALIDINKRLGENRAENVPTSKDILSCLSYFQSILIEWVRDTCTHYDRKKLSFDKNKSPTADYVLLYDALIRLITYSANVSNEELNIAVLQTLACVLPFMESDVIVRLPLVLSEQLYLTLPDMQTKIINLLAQYLIPIVFEYFTVNPEDEFEEINLSIPSILSTVLDSSADKILWSKIIECIMRFKRTVCDDLLYVVAHGTRDSLEAGVHLLNRYFPPVDIASVKVYHSPAYDTNVILKCQMADCDGAEDREAVKVCLDPSICAFINHKPPPLYFCEKCFERYCRDLKTELYLDVVQPVEEVIQFCANPECRVGFMKSVYFCFSSECTRKNNNRPLRLCEDCHSRLHSEDSSNHMYHSCLKDVWSMKDPRKTHLIDSVIRLWNEAQPDYQKKCLAMGLDVDDLYASEGSFLKRTYLTLHGVWLLRTTCPIPPKVYSLELMGRLLAMAFTWIESVEFVSHTQVTQVLNQSKAQALDWIKEVLKYDPDLYKSCLLPSPPLYTRVGNPWGMLTSVVRKDLELVHRLNVLGKYDLLPENVWDHVMPIWMQEIKSSVPAEEIKVFKKVLRELFDKSSKIRPPYAITFIKKRLESTIMKLSQEGLVWIQILSYLDVHLEISKLLEMFIDMLIQRDSQPSSTKSQNCSTSLSIFPFPNKENLQRVSSGGLSRQSSIVSPTSPTHVSSPVIDNVPLLTNITDDVSVSILVMDVLIKQLTLQKQRTGEVTIGNSESTYLTLLLLCMLDQSFEGKHSDHLLVECSHCQLMNVIFYQISLLVDLAIEDEVNVHTASEITQSVMRRKSSSNSARSMRSSRVSTSSQISTSSNTSQESVKVLDEEKRKVKEKEREELLVKEMIKIIDKRREAGKNCSLLFLESSSDDVLASNKWRFGIPELQIMQFLLQQLTLFHESSVTIHILSCLEVICLRGKCLEAVAEKDEELFHKMQTIMLVPRLWELLRTATSNIAQRVVPLLLHCACLPFGAKQVCCEMEQAMTNSDWRVRFSAIEKIGLICHFSSEEYIREIQLAQSVIVHGISYLSFATEDISSVVAAKASNMIQTIRLSSLKLMYNYLEAHFHYVNGDRLNLIHVYKTIHRILPKVSPLNPYFFTEMMKKVKKVESKQKYKQKQLFKEQSLINDTENPPQENIIAIYLRKLGPNNNRFGRANPKLSSFLMNAPNPLILYRNQFTLQAGKCWRDGSDKVRSLRMANIDPMDIPSTLDQVLDTLSEEAEEEAEEEEKTLRKNTTTLVSQSGFPEDEVFSALVSLMVEYLTVPPETIGRKVISYAEMMPIINFFASAMGFEQAFIDNEWKTPRKLVMRKFRKNPVFISFLMNLPKLLDRYHKHGQYFVPLALVTMVTCVKQYVQDDVFLSHTTLMRLNSHLRYSWLSSLVIILYKYPFEDSREEMWILMNIAKNTLDSHGNHSCKKFSWEETLTLSNVVAIKNRAKKMKKKLHNAKYSEDVDNRKSNAIELDEIPITTDIATLEEKAELSSSTNALFSLEDPTEDHLLEVTYKECAKCHLPLFQFEEECIHLVMVSLVAFIHMAPEMAAPFVIDVVYSVTKKADVRDSKNNLQLAISPTSGIAQQFLRCVFYQLAPSRLFPELFRVEYECESFFLVMGTVLHEFQHLTQLCPIKLSLSDFNDAKNQEDRILIFLSNLTTYTKQIVTYQNNPWEALDNVFSTFFKNIVAHIPVGSNMDCLLDLMAMLLFSHKSVFQLQVEHMEIVMSHIVRNCKFSVTSLKGLCNACVEAFVKERNQMKLVRRLCNILASVLTAKIAMADHSLETLIEFFADDVGTRVSLSNSVHEKFSMNEINYLKAFSQLDVMFSTELIDYLRSTYRRLKERHENNKTSVDFFHSFVKLSIAQIVAIYNVRLEPNKESRMHAKLMSFLNNVSTEQSPSEGLARPSLRGHVPTIESEDELPHFHVFTWILLGCINHAHLTGSPIPHLCPLPHVVSMATFINDVLASFQNESEDVFRKNKSKAKLQYAFLLMQIVTVFIEQHIKNIHQTLDASSPIGLVKEFWGRIMSAVFTLLQHSPRVRNEVIGLCASTIEKLAQYCPKTFSQLYPMWMPLLQCFMDEIPEGVIQTINITNQGGTFNRVDQHLAQWICGVQKQLWNIERMSKTRNIPMLVNA